MVHTCRACGNNIEIGMPFIWRYRNYFADDRQQTQYFRVHVECVDKVIKYEHKRT